MGDGGRESREEGEVENGEMGDGRCGTVGGQREIEFCPIFSSFFILIPGIIIPVNVSPKVPREYADVI